MQFILQIVCALVIFTLSEFICNKILILLNNRFKFLDKFNSIQPESIISNHFLSQESNSRCAGYTLINGSGLILDNCNAKSSRLCNDGRCSFHCRQNCKC
jgi:hypothetical protein